MMKSAARTVLQKLHLLNLFRRLRDGPVRRLMHVDEAIAREHLRGHASKKLHIGCGEHPIPGWLNTDYQTWRKDVMLLDATRSFPFGDAVFDYIFTEHMIEHIPYVDALRMLTECRRVIKPSGRIRITTPDIAFLIDLYRSDRSALQEDYIRWSFDARIEWSSDRSSCVVINNFVRDWGHQFIYDEGSLKHALMRAGFVGISRCRLNESEDPLLRDLENETRMPPGFLRLESLTLEAVAGD